MLPRHLRRKHKDEEAVKAALALPKTEQDCVSDALKKEGIYAKNVLLQAEQGVGVTLIRERSQGTQKTVMCSSCKGFYSKSRICQHKKMCSSAASSTTGARTVDFSSLRSDVSTRFQTEVLDRFRHDDIGEICRKDKVVLLLGQKLWAKAVQKDKRGVMSDMRAFASLFKKMNDVA